MKPEDPFAPLLRGIIVAVVLVIVVLMMAACAAPATTSEPAPKPAFPGDMRVVCYQGTYWIGSVSADQVVRLPLSCT